MFNIVKLCCFFIFFYSCNFLHSSTISNINHNFTNMSCKKLMFGLINESSFKDTFNNLNMLLAFDFERINDRYIMLKFVRTTGQAKGVIYGNFQLDLVNNTLENIDPETPIPIKINKNYIPFITSKCTSDQNIYIDTGALPNGEVTISNEGIKANNL